MNPVVEMGAEFAEKYGPFSVKEVVSFGMPVIKCDLCGGLVVKGVVVKSDRVRIMRLNLPEEPADEEIVATACIERGCAKVLLGEMKYNEVMFKLAVMPMLDANAKLLARLETLPNFDFYGDLKKEIYKALIHLRAKRGTKEERNIVEGKMLWLESNKAMTIEDLNWFKEYNKKCLRSMEVETL